MEPELTISTYSNQADTYAEYECADYPLFALNEEVGELMGLIAKKMRGDEKYTKDYVRENAKKELGDILWQLNACCNYFNLRLEDVAGENLKKLKDRKERGCLKGDGNNR